MRCACMDQPAALMKQYHIPSTGSTLDNYGTLQPLEQRSLT